ncbi:hypothetical protein E1258_09560 [Micromonospora sp. KC207]|uniref:hypothetical protein n=1 Tax=Micromonospora sp. KC207 TaxID=2530377 RepID=UPI00104DDA6C|nr:hypothetical protein [Micromonospora sp. KC207]TDC63882.1 hypothetical protein E1258_09560 [Micromonospora sp. KC207]
MTIRRALPALAVACLAVAGCSDTPTGTPAAEPTTAAAPATSATSADTGAEACRLVRALTEDTELEAADLGNIARLAGRAADAGLASAGRDLADAVSTVTTADDPRGEPMIALAEARIAVSRACDRIG